MSTQTNGRNPVRQAYGSYQLPIERRAVVAAGMVREHNWTQRQAAGLCCVNAGYVGLVQRLNDEDRLRLSRSEIKLSHLWKNYRRGLAERRAERLAAEREAQAQAERKAQVRAVDTVLGTSASTVWSNASWPILDPSRCWRNSTFSCSGTAAILVSSSSGCATASA
jgi:hypothetical protein